MSVNKNAQLRYNVIDKCLSNFHRKHTYYSILEEINDVLRDHSYEGIQLRQLQANITYMESDAGFGIALAEGLKDGKYGGISNYALDRINAVEETGKAYKKTSINWQDYFDEIIGVTKPNGGHPEKIVLRFSEKRINYVKTKPLHGVTQKLVKTDPEVRTIQIEVIPNFELYQVFLSYGPDVEVVSPLFIREEMKRIIEKMQSVYNNGDDTIVR